MRRSAGTSWSGLPAAGLALLGGVLLAAPFLWPFLWWVHYVALVPWALLVTRAQLRLSVLYVLVGACVSFSIALQPFALFHMAVPIVVGTFVLAPFLILFALVIRRGHLRFRLPLTLLVPVAWVASEWLRVEYSTGKSAIYPLGTAQVDNLRLVQIADLTGVAGISFLVACASGALADSIFGWKARRWRSLWPVAAFLVLVTAAITYGDLRLRQFAVEDFVEGPRVAIIQPNVTHFRDPVESKAVFQQQVEFTREEIAPGSADLVVLPENAISVPIGDDPSYMEELGALAREQRAPVVVGAFTWASRTPPRVYTSAYHLSSRGEFIARYHKLHLLPWAEYMPFESWLAEVSPVLYRAQYAFAERMLGYNSFGVPGRELVIFSLEHEDRTVRFATPICFEVSSGEFGRHAVARGADFLLNVTSEGVFGRAIYVHMLAHSRLRAIENRVAVARVGNNGISGVIDPGGRVRSLVKGKRTGRLYLEEGTLIDRVPLNPEAGKTFYTERGDLLAYGCAGASSLLLVLSFVPRRRPSAESAPGMSSRP